MPNKQTILFLSFCLIFTLSGCQKQEASDTVLTTEAISAEIKPAVDSASAATLSGKVFFGGTVPALEKLSIGGNPECAVFHPGGGVPSEELLVKNGALQNVFVYIKEGLEGRSFPVPSQAATIDNKNCVYVPHVMGVQTGQPVNILNSDPTLHNVHSYSKNSKSWNLGLPFQGMKQVKKFEASEVMIALKCDVHPWMKGYVGVLDHPYFQVTGEDGGFSLKDLPPGEYVVEAWHEKLGTQSQKVQIGPQETKQIEFKF
jgi:plastocyanin